MIPTVLPTRIWRDLNIPPFQALRRIGKRNFSSRGCRKYFLALATPCFERALAELHLFSWLGAVSIQIHSSIGTEFVEKIRQDYGGFSRELDATHVVLLFVKAEEEIAAPESPELSLKPAFELLHQGACISHVIPRRISSQEIAQRNDSAREGSAEFLRGSADASAKNRSSPCGFRMRFS